MLQGRRRELALKGKTGTHTLVEVLGFSPPDPTLLDQYSDADLDLIRTTPELDIGTQFDLDASDFADTRFRRLTLGQDYTFDPILGTVTLTRQLADFEVLGVAYQYTDGTGSTVQVGDFGESTSSTDRRIILKLIRDERPVPQDASWGLTMRNIYRVGGGGLSPAVPELGPPSSSGTRAPA